MAASATLHSYMAGHMPLVSSRSHSTSLRSTYLLPRQLLRRIRCQAEDQPQEQPLEPKVPVTPARQPAQIPPKPKAKVTSPVGSTVHSLKGSSGDKFEFKAPRAGMYKFCFHNPSRTPETVSFYIHTGHIPNEHNLAKDEHLDPINVKIAELREALESVTAEQRYLKAREARHRRTNESTRKRLIFYTITEYLVLACASGLQVVYIRRLFSKSVGYNMVY